MERSATSLTPLNSEMRPRSSNSFSPNIKGELKKMTESAQKSMEELDAPKRDYDDES